MKPKTIDAASAATRYFQTSHLKADLKGRSVRGGAVTLTVQVAKFTLQTMSTMVLARLLTPQDYGLFGMVAVVTGFVAVFKDMGLSTATVQRKTIEHQQVSMLFWINVGVSLLLVVGTAACAPAVSWFYKEPRLTWVTVALAGTFLFSGLTVQHNALLQRQMCFATLGAIEIASMAAGIVTAVIMAWHHMGYWALAGMSAAMAASEVVLVWMLCGWRPGPPSRGSGVRSMIAFGSNLTGFNCINYFSRNADNALIGWYWGAAALGLYAKAYGLLMLPIKQVNKPLSSVAIPVLSRLQGEPERYRKAFLKMIEKLALLTMPLVTFSIVTADWIINIFLGPQWSESASVFAWLGALAVIQPIGSAVGWLFVTQNRTAEMLRLGILAGVLILASFVVGLPWGSVGVAASYSVSGIVLRTPIIFWYAGRRGPVRTADMYRALALPLAAACSVGTVLALYRLEFHPSQVTGLLVSAVLTVAVTLATLGCLPAGRRSLMEIRDLAAGLRRRAPAP